MSSAEDISLGVPSFRDSSSENASGILWGEGKGAWACRSGPVGLDLSVLNLSVRGPVGLAEEIGLQKDTRKKFDKCARSPSGGTEAKKGVLRRKGAFEDYRFFVTDLHMAQ